MNWKCVPATLMALLFTGGCGDGSGASRDEDTDRVAEGDDAAGGADDADETGPATPLDGLAMTPTDCGLVDADSVVAGGDEVHVFIQVENGGEGTAYTQRDGYMVGNGSGWTCYTLPDGMRPERARLFADGSFAAFWVGANGLYFARGNPTNFSLTDLAIENNDFGVHWDATIDDRGVAHVVFTGAGDLGPSVYYATLSATEVGVEMLIERDGYANPALFVQIDATNKIHVISISGNQRNHYVTGTKGTFVTTSFAAPNFNPRFAHLVRDAAGAPVLLSFVENGGRYDLKAVGAEAGFSGEGTTILAGVSLYDGFLAQQDASGTWYVMADRDLYKATSPSVSARLLAMSSEIAGFAVGASGTAHVMGYEQNYALDVDPSGELLYVAVSEAPHVVKRLSPVVNTYYSTPIVLANDSGGPVQ